MRGEFEKVDAAAAMLAARVPSPPTVALVLGSGLGDYADTLEGAVAVDYADIPGFHASTVSGHAGRLVFGERAGVRIAAMQGRIHAYEGHDAATVVFPLRTLWRLGARTLVVTNAAGGANPGFVPGDLMCITDHLNLTGTSPLVGENDERFGPRFPDMSEAYSKRLAAIARAASADAGFVLRSGVYAGMLGPAYETPAEVRMVQRLGGDAVGMSTVLEVIAARHLKMDVLGLSCITNFGAGLSDAPLDHAEVKEVASRVRSRFVALLDGVFAKLGVAS
ncbi:MAG: purine-nucleoside phosphorylase [Myxococcales bacterium]|nr:purine-nucleoside phosphorylase [Myxococcales bacterium]MCB9519702.1 purine-nucleoside phosphorylase [Myxococcales bacterium]MCB9530393.1 purine-nucleoside phosphorylase [Myxococcales bacterium]MCB9533640.1 purine-nucleoside phosphorylase [Myxococcales bacterium]